MQAGLVHNPVSHPTGVAIPVAAPVAFPALHSRAAAGTNRLDLAALQPRRAGFIAVVNLPPDFYVRWTDAELTPFPERPH
jgi:hypothetical protein